MSLVFIDMLRQTAYMKFWTMENMKTMPNTQWKILQTWSSYCIQYRQKYCKKYYIFWKEVYS